MRGWNATERNSNVSGGIEHEEDLRENEKEDGKDR